jgi:Peptidase M50B-like
MFTDSYDGTPWKLTGCCGTEERIFIILYVVYGLLIHFFFQQQLFYPFKLLAVFVHEMGHGSAAWLTCGKVKSIVVNLDQSGTASYTGGIQWIVIPAGYVGGAFWGGAFVALSGSRIGATVAACVVSTALLLALA